MMFEFIAKLVEAGVDVRLALAMEVAQEIGAEVCNEHCPSCHTPLLEKTDQHIPFCWFCMTDRMAAQRGRTALTKAKMASKGIFVVEENMHPTLAAGRQFIERSSWPEGWTL